MAIDLKEFLGRLPKSVVVRLGFFCFDEASLASALTDGLHIFSERLNVKGAPSELIRVQAVCDGYLVKISRHASVSEQEKKLSLDKVKLFGPGMPKSFHLFGIT